MTKDYPKQSTQANLSAAYIARSVTRFVHHNSETRVDAVSVRALVSKHTEAPVVQTRRKASTTRSRIAENAGITPANEPIKSAPAKPYNIQMGGR
jgi:hypothetical protein